MNTFYNNDILYSLDGGKNMKLMTQILHLL